MSRVIVGKSHPYDFWNGGKRDTNISNLLNTLLFPAKLLYYTILFLIIYPYKLPGLTLYLNFLNSLPPSSSLANWSSPLPPCSSLANWSSPHTPSPPFPVLISNCLVMQNRKLTHPLHFIKG